MATTSHYISSISDHVVINDVITSNDDGEEISGMISPPSSEHVATEKIITSR